jgi:DNA-binding PadR family transcriptional regulator
LAIHHAVLGLLAGGPSYGYELKANFERAIGPQWGELNIGHLYQVLERLERDGLVTGKDIPQEHRPDKRTYRLTKEGRAELNRWLDEPSTRPGGYRDDVFLKLFVASRLGEQPLRAVLTAQRAEYLAELASLGDLRARHRADALVTLLLDAATFDIEAKLRVVERAESGIDALVAQAADETADTTASKTGRRQRSSAG